MTTAAELLAAARNYAPRAIALHGITDAGNCTCPKRDACPSPGKHPRHASWQRVSARDTRRELETRICNLGVRTGSGLVVVDVDPRNGGADSLADLERDLGPLGDTPRVHTGGAGLHVYLSGPSDLRSITIAAGVEIKAAGRQVVAPPSRHISGDRYRWSAAHPFRPDAIAALPAAWTERIGTRALAASLSGSAGQLQAHDDVLKGIAPPLYVAAVAAVELGARTPWSRNANGDPRAAYCPLHEDHGTPNLLVWDTPDGGWYCNACGVGGGIYEFAAAHWGIPAPLRGPNFLTVRDRLLDLLTAYLEQRLALGDG